MTTREQMRNISILLIILGTAVVCGVIGLIILGTAMVCGVIGLIHAEETRTLGYSAGYAAGHDAGIADRQQTVFNEGFMKGVDMERNWNKLAVSTFNQTSGIWCNKLHPDTCYLFDSRMTKRWEYHDSIYSNMLYPV